MPSTTMRQSFNELPNGLRASPKNSFKRAAEQKVEATLQKLSNSSKPGVIRNGLSGTVQAKLTERSDWKALAEIAMALNNEQRSCLRTLLDAHPTSKNANSRRAPEPQEEHATSHCTSHYKANKAFLMDSQTIVAWADMHYKRSKSTPCFKLWLAQARKWRSKHARGSTQPSSHTASTAQLRHSSVAIGSASVSISEDSILATRKEKENALIKSALDAAKGECGSLQEMLSQKTRDMQEMKDTAVEKYKTILVTMEERLTEELSKDEEQQCTIEKLQQDLTTANEEIAKYKTSAEALKKEIKDLKTSHAHHALDSTVDALKNEIKELKLGSSSTFRREKQHRPNAPIGLEVGVVAKRIEAISRGLRTCIEKQTVQREAMTRTAQTAQDLEIEDSVLALEDELTNFKEVSRYRVIWGEIEKRSLKQAYYQMIAYCKQSCTHARIVGQVLLKRQRTVFTKWHNYTEAKNRQEQEFLDYLKQDPLHPN